MTQKEQIDHFATELDALVDRFAEEYDLPYASVVGVLQLKIVLLCKCWDNSPDEEET